MNLILFGFKSCGKTFLGKKVAEKLKRPFIDTDDLLPESPRQLYQKLGEKSFRACEKEALFSLNVQHTVIALGGGAVLDPDNAAFLQRLGTLVYLKASPTLLKWRIFAGPLPAILEHISLAKLLTERLPIYESLSPHHVDVERADALDVLCSIAEAHGI